MKRFAALVVVVLLAVPSFALAKGLEINKTSGGYEAMVVIDRNPPVVGKNGISIRIKDKGGAFVTDAMVRVEYSMPAMPGMPAMLYKADAERKDAEYSSVMDLSMAGPWNVVVKVLMDGKVTSFKFNIDAR